jgi:hypothetical protein
MSSLLPATLRRPEALAASPAPAPAAGSILKLACGSLAARGRTLGSRRSAVAPWSGLFFSRGSPGLAILLFTGFAGFPRTRRVLTAAGNAFSKSEESSCSSMKSVT